MKTTSCLINNEIYFESHGDQTQPCIILIHGLGCQLIHWSNVFIEGLVKAGFYVITFDNRDCGLSHHYNHLDSPDLNEAIGAKQLGKDIQVAYTLEDMASDVVMLMNHLSIDKATILGTSMGGMIAQIVALDYENRLSNLILIETSSGDLPPGFFSLPEDEANETLETYVDSKTKLYQIYNPHFFNEEKIRLIHKAAFERSYAPDGCKRQLLAIIAGKPRGERLKQLKVKSLIIQGSEDPVFPIEHGKYLKECILDSQLEIVEKMGHGLPDELCEKIVTLISNFINKESALKLTNSSDRKRL